MSVRTPWLSWRSPEITEVSWFDFELNWRSTFRWKWLIPRQIPRSSARLLRCRGRLVLRNEWSYQTQVRRSISFFSFYTLTLKSYCWADPCPHGANESETNYPFWDLDINFMLKMLFILDNFARCWTNQWVNRKHNSFLTYCLSYACHFRTQSKYDANYSESEELTDHLNNCCWFVSNVLKNHASFRFSEGSLMVV